MLKFGHDGGSAAPGVRHGRNTSGMRPSDIQSFAARSKADIEAIARDPEKFAAMRDAMPTVQRWLTARSAEMWRKRALKQVDVIVAGMRKG